MLEAMRQNSRSAIIYILFGVLIAAFVISFGPSGLGLGGGGASNPVGAGFAAKVLGNKLEDSEFRFVYTALRLAEAPPNVARERHFKEFTMDRLIERELLAEEAERLGLAVSEDEASELVAGGRLLALGQLAPIPGYAFRDGRFDYERFRSVAQNYYGVNIKKLMEIQQREMLADKLRQILRAGTKVAPDEVKADFEDKGRQVNLSYVRFAPSRYEEDLNPTDSEVEAWAKGHEDEIKKVYEERKQFLYTKQEKSAHLRQILVELDKDADAEKTKVAEGKIQAAQNTLKSGTPFAQVARTASEDATSKSRGGDLGWRRKGRSGLGDEAEGKIFAAKEGEVLGPLKTERGLVLLRVEGFREGDISLEKARAELAQELWRGARAKELARKAADEAAAKVKAGGKLADLFPKATDAEEAQVRTNKAPRIEAEDTGLFARRGDVLQGLGSSAELAKLVFGGKVKDGEVLGPLEVTGSWVVATVKERKEPDLTDFEKRKDELSQQFQQTKWFEVVQAWAKTRCTEVHSLGKIQVNPDVLAYEDRAAREQGLPPLATKYEPCQGTKL